MAIINIINLVHAGLIMVANENETNYVHIYCNQTRYVSPFALYAVLIGDSDTLMNFTMSCKINSTNHLNFTLQDHECDIKNFSLNVYWKKETLNCLIDTTSVTAHLMCPGKKELP